MNCCLCTSVYRQKLCSILLNLNCLSYEMLFSLMCFKHCTIFKQINFSCMLWLEDMFRMCLSGHLPLMHCVYVENMWDATKLLWCTKSCCTEILFCPFFWGRGLNNDCIYHNHSMCCFCERIVSNLLNVAHHLLLDTHCFLMLLFLTFFGDDELWERFVI